MAKKAKRRLTTKAKILLILLFIPIACTMLVFAAVLFIAFQNASVFGSSATAFLDAKDKQSDSEVPVEYVALYQEAADAYGIPWTLLAAHHRIETRFSTMDPLLSPVGAEGHMQFMPCTFVGWQHPSCEGLGKGEISIEEKTNPVVIKQYGGYGVDGDGDGIADPYNLTDAMYSAANYLARSGAATGEYEKAIFNYNRSDKYVQDVMWFFTKFEEERNELEIAAQNL